MNFVLCRGQFGLSWLEISEAMTTSKKRLLSVGGIYFLILLGIAFWIRDLPNQPNAFKTTIRQLIEQSTMGDPASFATAAIDIAKNGWISSANDWIFNLWPPGFMLLEAVILATLGPNVPIILVLQVLAAGLFSTVLVLLYGILRTRVANIFAVSLPLLIFTFPVARVFLLQPTGISLGESFAVGFFLLFIFLALHAKMINSISYGVCAGLCLALSAYFRSQFEFILLVLTGWGVLLGIGVYLNELRNRSNSPFVKSSVKTIAVVLLVAHAATMPWRAYHWTYQDKPYWVATASVMIKNSVMSSAYLEKVGAGWIVEGGGNLVCRIDSATCGDTINAKNLFITTFLKNPLEWLSLKISLIGKYWFSSIQNWTAVEFKSTLIDFFINGFLLAGLVVTIILLGSRGLRSGGAWVLLAWINISLFSAYGLIFTFAHFETRYFYFPKIAIIIMLLISLSQYSRLSDKNNDKEASMTK